MEAGKYTIRWRYHRYDPTPKMDKSDVIFDDGNYTTCIIVDDEDKDADWGTARCHAKDNFNKDTGRRISLARCMKSLRIPKDERKEIWEAYRQMTSKGRW